MNSNAKGGGGQFPKVSIEKLSLPPDLKLNGASAEGSKLTTINLVRFVSREEDVMIPVNLRAEIYDFTTNCPGILKNLADLLLLLHYIQFQHGRPMKILLNVNKTRIILVNVEENHENYGSQTLLAEEIHDVGR